MRRLSFVAALCTLAMFLVSCLAQVARADGSAGPVYYSNGAVANAAKECEAGDVCATITEANGDVIKVSTGESGRCNPYVITFMRYVKDQLVAVWSTPTDRNPDHGGTFGGTQCGGFRNTHMKVDKGVIDMGVFQNTDGKVFVLFFGGSTTK
jgi:hypothetical protein